MILTTKWGEEVTIPKHVIKPKTYKKKEALMEFLRKEYETILYAGPEAHYEQARKLGIFKECAPWSAVLKNLDKQFMKLKKQLEKTYDWYWKHSLVEHIRGEK